MTDRTPSSLALKLCDDLHHVVALARAASVLSYFEMDWELAQDKLQQQLESIQADAERLYRALAA